MDQAFVVYWRSAPRQLFSFRQSVTAASPKDARGMIKHALQRQRPIVVGVKGLAPCGRLCTHRGRWIG